MSIGNWFPSHDHKGIGGAIESLSNDIGEMLSQLFQAAQSGVGGLVDLFQGGQTGAPVTNGQVEQPPSIVVGDIPSDKPQLHEIESQIGVPTTLAGLAHGSPQIPDNIDHPQSKVKLTVKFWKKGEVNGIQITNTWTQTKGGHIATINAIEQKANNLAKNSKLPSWVVKQELSKLLGYQNAFKAHYGHFASTKS